ncbi:MAG: preprotein translocase subunit SecY [Planctomycetota bacterium]|nr:MAG: preprotein translocase subunit SecY [Planctomycetota bacterium]
MFRAFVNVFRIPDLRNKVLFTLLMLAVYRVGFYVPLPGLNQEALSGHFERMGGGAAEQAVELFAMFTGGQLGQSTLFGLGIMPYISASIILQIMMTVVPALEKLQKEGESGRRKIMEYTRYGTVALCFIQAIFWVSYLNTNGLVYSDYAGTYAFSLMAVTGLMTGTLLLMWIGEQIDEYGVGNGISLIIMAGIIVRLPSVIIEVIQGLNFNKSLSGGTMTPVKVLFLILAFVGVVAGAILITQAQRRIPVQQAKQARGRRVVGGARHYLPLKVNHGGVMPIIFASSFLLLPGWLFGMLARPGVWGANVWFTLADLFRPGAFVYEVLYIAMVYVFAYFWVSIQFQPKELANNLRDMGSFIPGLRPGKRTADYLERVMERITYVGAGFLAIIAVIPTVVAVQFEIPFRISAFLGGTGLLIVVSVGLDFIQRLEANLIMRNYEGFLGGEGEGARIKGGRY